MSTRVSSNQYTKDEPSLMARMRKIEGQAKGIQRMIEEERYCLDMVDQLRALSAAVDEVSLLILNSHVGGCVLGALPLYLKQIRIQK